MSNVIEHTEKEFEEALREELEDDVEGEVLAELFPSNSSAQSRPNSPKYPPGINLAGSPPRGFGLRVGRARSLPTEHMCNFTSTFFFRRL
jgi:hypothetical protein